jgi:ATP-dependent Clp protease ATP-binding subunit ClpA
MFERFTDRARRVVVSAQEEARHLGHTSIGTEHLLLGLLHEGDGVAAVALRRLNITLTDVRADVVGIIGEGDAEPSGHIPFAPRSKKVLELSLREALQLGHNFIGTEHILLGLIREGEGVAAQILVARGTSLERVRTTVMSVVGMVGEDRERVAPKVTPGAEAAIADARQLAGTSPMGSSHLLEALARSEDTSAAKVLAALGVDTETLATKIDEVGTDGTSDEMPEEAAARLMELRVDDDAVHVVLRDQATVDLVRSIVEAYGGPMRGDEPAAGSMVGLWETVVGGIEAIRDQISSPVDEPAAAAGRPNIVRQAIQARLARRRRV